MKKLTTLVLAAGLMVSSFAGASSASAAEFRPTATFINQFEWADTGSRLAGAGGLGYVEHFRPSTRIDMGFDYIMNENLSATFLVRTEFDYGSGEFDSSFTSLKGGQSPDDFTLGVRLAYVDWMIPTTDVQVRLGYQPIAMPAFAFGSAVIDTRGSGVAVIAPVNDNIGVVAQWIRAEGDDFAGAAGETKRGADDADIFALVADFNYDGFRIAPWAMYAMAGENATVFAGAEFDEVIDAYVPGHDTDVWWIGASFELSMFDPLVFALDAYYSHADRDTHGSDHDQDGFFVGASFSYGTQWGTPALKTWYASGDDDNGDLGRPYAISGAFNATSIMFNDQVMDNGASNYTGGDPAGTWGVLIEWADISFIEKLSHTARIAYIGGTNATPKVGALAQKNPLGYLYDDDSVIEFNFNSTYEIYKNLSTSLEIGYLAADFDHHYHNDEDDDIFRTALSFKYSF